MRGCVRSVWAVELLLVLRRAPDVAWSPEELVRELRGSRGLVAEVLGWFVTGGISQELSPDRYAYLPATDLIDKLCEELEAEYRKRPLAVINAVVRNKKTNIHRLADAFRFHDK